MIVVTGATGKLGRLVLEGLLKVVPAGQIVAAVRDPQKATDLSALGVTVRAADYNDPASLQSAFAGAEKVLLISSNDLAHRIAQQQAVVDAAKATGVQLLAYTSLINLDRTSIGLARDHRATEQAIRESGLKYVMLRDDWYLENHTGQLAPALAHGVILGSAGEGRFAAAARADYAAAAVAVLTGTGHENKVYELAGDAQYSYSDLAAELSKQSGKTVVYKDLPEAEYAKTLEGFGLPAEVATMLADADAGAAKGDLESTSKDLGTLIGRPTQTLAEAVAVALKA